MKSTSHRDGVLRGGYAALIRLLLVIAAGVSGYLLSVSLSGGNAVGCAPGSACDVVLQSRWAYVLGVPVSALALLVDAVLLLMTFSCGAKAQPKTRRKAWELILPASILVLGGALWFVALQLVVVKSICPWCMTAHAAGSIAAVLLLLRFPMKESVERREKDPAVARGTAMKLGIAALLAFALFAVAQIAVAPKTFTVANIPASTNVTPTITASNLSTNVVSAAPVITNKPAPAPLTNTSVAAAPVAMAKPFEMFGGAVKLDLAQVPVWGSTDAPHKLVSLYDYSCHHCAIMHSRVVAIAHEFAPRLAVVSLPMPLDSKCNPLMKRTPPAHLNACAYARIGLAVWRAKPQAIEPYDDWFFDVFTKSQAVPPQPPTVEAATERAIELVGRAKLEEALREPWIEQQIAADVAIYETSFKQYKNGSMPQFIIGTNLVSGTLETAQLKAIVEKYVRTP